MTIAIENASIGTPLNSGAGGTTGTITTNVTCAAGSTIAIVAYNLDTVSTVTDNSGNGYTWTIDKASTNTGSVTIATVYASAGLASGTVITVTYVGTANERQIAGLSWTSGASASRVDQTNSRTDFGSGTAWNSSSITPTVAASIVIGAFGDFGTGGAITSAPDAGWTEWADLDNGANLNVTAVYQIVANTTARNPSGNFSASMIGDQAGVTVNYKEGAAPAAAVSLAWTVA